MYCEKYSSRCPGYIPNSDVNTFYISETTEDYYDGEDGEQAYLESRAKRAYDGYWQAETARRAILDTDLAPPLDQLYKPVRALEPYSETLHADLTGVSSSAVRDPAHGRTLAAERLPKKPSRAADIRETAQVFADAGTTLLRHLRFANDSGDFATRPELYDDLWANAAALCGNVTAIHTGIDPHFVRDARRFLLDKHREWNDDS